MNWDEANREMLTCNCGTDLKPICFTHEGDIIPELGTGVIFSASCKNCGFGSTHPDLEGLVELWNRRASKPIGTAYPFSRERCIEMEENKEPEGSPLKVDELPESFWSYLTPEAEKILHTPQANTILEFDQDEITGKLWPTRPRLPTKPIKDDGRPNCEYRRVTRFVAYFCKRVRLDMVDGVGHIPEWALRKTAAVMNRLVEDGMIDYGILAPPFGLPLAHGKVQIATGKTTDMGPPSVLICLYVYPTSDLHFDKVQKELNAHLKNEAFVTEGAMGNEDWDGLPDQ